MSNNFVRRTIYYTCRCSYLSTACLRLQFSSFDSPGRVLSPRTFFTFQIPITSTLRA